MPPDQSYYEKADCSLFRTPSINTAPLQELIERAIMQNWQQGMSASSAIDSILSDEKIVGTVRGQIENNLEFQSKAEMEAQERKKQYEIRLAKERHAQRLGEINSILGGAAKTGQDALAAASQRYTAVSTSYSEAQRRLDELRQSIRDSMSKVGGVEGYQHLIDINNQLAAEVPKQIPVVPEDKQVSSPDIKYEVQPEVSGKTTYTAPVAPIQHPESLANATIPPQQAFSAKPHIPQEQKPIHEAQRKRGFVTRVFMKIGKAFGYYNNR